MSAQAGPWLGLVAAPLLFLINMQVSFMLVPWVCGHGSAWLIHLAHGLALALIALCGVPAWGARHRTSGGQQFISYLSLSMSGFVALSLVAHWIPNLILGACE